MTTLQDIDLDKFIWAPVSTWEDLYTVWDWVKATDNICQVDNEDFYSSEGRNELALMLELHA